MRAAWLLHAVLVALVSASQVARAANTPSASPPVKVQLRAPWKRPSLAHNGSSLLLEIFEAANAHDPDSFFPLVTSLTAPWNAHDGSEETAAASRRHKGKAHKFHAGPSLAALSDRQLIHRAEDAIRTAHLFGREDDQDQREAVDAQLQLWHTSLALHNQSPRVQAFMQLYETLKLEERWKSKVTDYKGGAEQCGSWIDWHGQVLCDEDELVQAVRKAGAGTKNKQAPVRPLPFDHVLPLRQNTAGNRGTGSDNDAEADEVTAILYGDPFSANFWRLHSLLEPLAGTSIEGSRRRLVYVLRWKPSSNLPSQSAPAREPTLYLGGYGAYLDLKKVDYLVIDDRKLREDANLGAATRKLFDAETAGEESEQLSQEGRRWLEDEIGELAPRPPPDESPSQAESAEGHRDGRLTKEEVNELGLRATRLIASSSDPLRALEELSQNFPLYAERLARSAKLAEWDEGELVQSLLGLADRRIQSGASEVWLNGRSLEEQEFGPLNLIKTLADERRLVTPLLSDIAGGFLDRETAVDLISSLMLGRAFVAAGDAEPSQSFFDASDRLERQSQAGSSAADEPNEEISAITWWNDVTQGATSRWSKDLFNLLRPMWPGQFPQLSLNLFNVVMVLDLSKRESCRFLAESIGPSIGKVGLRWGLVPGGLEGGGDSVMIARLYWEVFELGGAEAATSFLRKLASAKAGSPSHVSIKVAKDEASLILHNHVEADEVSERVDAVIEGKDAKLKQREAMARSYIDRLRATDAESPRGHVFVNGQHIPFNSQLIQMLHQKVQEQIQILAPLIYHRIMTDESENLETFFYDQPSALKFRSKLIFPPVSTAASPAEAGAAPLPPSVTFESVDIVSALSELKSSKKDAQTLNRFLYPGGEGGVEYVNSTLWLIGDLDSRDGADLVKKTLTTLQGVERPSDRFRVGFLHVPSTRPRDTTSHASASPSLSALLHQMLENGSLEQLSPAQLLETLATYTPPRDNLDQDDKIGVASAAEEEQLRLGPESAAGHAAEAGWSVPATSAAAKFWERAGAGVAAALRLKARRGSALLVHGKLVQGFKVDDIGPEDIAALVTVESAKKVDAVVRALTTLKPEFHDLPPRNKSDLVSAVSSIAVRAYAVDAADEGVFVKGKQPRTGVLDTFGTDEHVVELGDRSTALLRLSILLDPLSESAQKWSTILRAASKIQGVHVRILLNPKLAYGGSDEVPLKRFYRFSAPTKLRFDEDGREVPQELSFYGMPEQAVLTLGLDTPPAWLTMPEEAVYDLDNIRLSDVPTSSRKAGVKAVYELKHILIEGHARDDRGKTPRGLQLLLETPDGSRRLDTIVMANLAYLQFKAQPGLWKLAIRPGRSSQLYEMVSVGNLGWDSPGVELTGADITLDTLTGLKIYPVVRKRKGKETEELLEELDAQGRPIRRPGSDVASAGGVLGLLNRVVDGASHAVSHVVDRVSGGSASSDEATGLSSSPHADINIFTVASGHLYERMAYIMILSVLRHTQSSVKFWFIENFLSPSFKEFIPHLAAEYGFRYELVTYAWPHWLRPQREKQRTIWGYKILFLDTLFPLDLSKVIFVDADQVVRTDLKELVDLDLGGAVYGYPPMGDDSEDMDGFRFWKHGYWKDYLQGRPYHISALYVVDLHRFRRVAAGDKLRGQYQALSADAGSLANLDQDLPNNMQSMLPIHTLDREWLWCETWCSADWLSDAKTIDLCSNPKTKEPKLARARRQIPEWTELDDEVARLASRVARSAGVTNVVDPVADTTTATPAPAGQVGEGDGTAKEERGHDEL